MKLENRICACGCRKTFKCLPSSKTKYSSLACMESAGEMIPVEKFARSGKAGRPAGSKNAPKKDEDDAPMMMVDEDHADLVGKSAPQIEATSI